MTQEWPISGKVLANIAGVLTDDSGIVVWLTEAFRAAIWLA